MKKFNRDLYVEHGETLMTNFDHTIEPDAEQILKSGKIYSGYPAWNFHGEVWFEGQFYCEIWVYGTHVNTLCADTLQEIMDKASEYYGYD